MTAADENRRRSQPSLRFNALLPLLAVWTVGLVVVAVVVIQNQVPAEDLFLDATFVGGQKWYVGMVAALGTLAWTTSVCFCLMAAWVAGLDGRSSARSAFRSGGLLFALLLLDDLFLFHSNLLPQSVGIPRSSCWPPTQGSACCG